MRVFWKGSIGFIHGVNLGDEYESVGISSFNSLIFHFLRTVNDLDQCADIFYWIGKIHSRGLKIQ